MLLIEDLTTAELRRDSLPLLDITQDALDALPEYSASIPTGVTLGKTWKCNLHFRQWIYQGLDPFGTPMIKWLDPYPCWVIRRYEYHSDTQCIVRDYCPVIVSSTKEA